MVGADVADYGVEFGDLGFQTAEFAVEARGLAFDGHEADEAAGMVAQGVEADPDGVGLAVFVVVNQLDGEGAGEAHGAAEGGDGFGVGGGALEEVAGFAAFELGGGVTAEGGEGFVDPFDTTLGVGDDDGIGQLVGDRREGAGRFHDTRGLGVVVGRERGGRGPDQAKRAEPRACAARGQAFSPCQGAW